MGPVKLRVVKDTRTERRKTCFFCRTGFERAGFFEKNALCEIRSSRLT
jgi:hypothetical protein